MNKRIKELYAQACEYGLSFTAANPSRTPDQIRPGLDLNGLTQSKFAELIVRECYNIANEHDCNQSGNGGEILNHFGIEE